VSLNIEKKCEFVRIIVSTIEAKIILINGWHDLYLSARVWIIDYCGARGINNNNKHPQTISACGRWSHLRVR
jgi:hypothetical protein